ncbi:hypothetical protein [Brevundimonas sp.]|uniref:hypothetical protein n=1 Tax=Brevundimonas sp. TaxID=1871086 RepID=UPI002FC7C166
MTVTYPADPLKPYGDRVEVKPLPGDRMDVNPRLGTAEEPFVPVYARRGKAARGANNGKIKTWMILAPLGVIVLGGIVAMTMLDTGGDTAAPLAEPAATAPVVSATPLIEAAPATSASTPAPVAAPAPAPVAVLREATPVRRAAAPAPVRRAATPTAPRDATTTVAPRTATPAPTSPATSTLNTAPTTPAPAITPAQEPAPPAPVIVVEPLN